jgi:hypothetical protein
LRDQFTFYRSFWEAIQDLKKADRQAVLEAIISYALNDLEPVLQGTPHAIFTLIRPVLDAAKKKAESGRAGGEANRKQSGSKRKANRKQSGREKEGEIEKESLDSFSIENESAALAPDRPDGGGAARRYGTYDPDIDESKIVYREFGDT